MISRLLRNLVGLSISKERYLLFNTTELEAEQATLLEETQLISDMVQQTIYENAHIALDQTEYQKRYEGLTQ